MVWFPFVRDMCYGTDRGSGETHRLSELLERQGLLPGGVGHCLLGVIGVAPKSHTSGRGYSGTGTVSGST